MLRALIFDVDGTLADTERDGHRIAFNRAFADAGLRWQWDDVCYGQLLTVAGGIERLLHAMGSAAAPTQQPQAERSALAKRLHAAKTAHYVRLVADGGITLRPGIARLLTQARQAGLALAIATTTSRANVDALLDHTLGVHARGWFSVIACAEDAAPKKPDPAVYLHVLAHLGLSAGQCLAIEDSAIGLAAARAAGIPTLVTANDYTRGQDFSAAIAVLDGLGDPDRPARRLAGPALYEDMVDLDQLREAHAAVAGGGRLL